MTANVKLWQGFAAGVVAALSVAGALYLLTRDADPAAPAAPAPRPHGPVAVAPATAPAPARAAVQVAPGQAAGIGLTLATVGKGEVAQELSAIATVVPDESRISHIHTRVSGWIEHLHVGNTGEVVRAGQPIADIFSQELFASQAEYLAARALAGPPTVVAESGRARLKFFGMSEREIRAIEKSGKPNRVVTLYAPRSGVLAHRGISAGTAVDPSTEIAVILDLSRVWVWAEVPEFAAASIKPGMQAQLSFGSGAAAPLMARVEFIDPIFTEATRTLRVRFALPNSSGELRPGMYGTALFKTAPRRALTVPRDALVDTGAAQYVYVASGEGMYQPRPVRIGTRLAESVEILDGLHEGEKVVVSGVFLLDSESRLRASGGQAGAHGGHGAAPAPAPATGPAPGAAHAEGRHD